MDCIHFRVELSAPFLELLDFFLERYVLPTRWASQTLEDIAMHHSASFLPDRSLVSDAQNQLQVAMGIFAEMK